MDGSWVDWKSNLSAFSEMIMGNLCRQTCLRNPFYYKAKGILWPGSYELAYDSTLLYILVGRPPGLDGLCLHCIQCANI